MSTVPTRTDAPEALCPICGAVGTGRSFPDQDFGLGITRGDYLCPSEHIWTTRWVGGDA